MVPAIKLKPDRKWDRESADDLAKFYGAQCAPPCPDPMWQWWEKNIEIRDGPFPGPYRTDLTPMSRWIAEWAQDPRVKKIVGMGAAQTLKTCFLLNLFNWIVNEAAGTVMWIMADGDSIREFWTKRLAPSIDGCAKTTARFISRIKDLICFDSLNLLLRGANSRAKLQSDPVRYLICDERREWKRGAIDLARKRTRTYSESKEISMGTAGEVGDELHGDYKEGSQTMPHFNCLKCGHSQPFRFGRDKTSMFPEPRALGGMRWPQPGEPEYETVRPGGQWDFVALKKHVTFECESCGARFTNDDKYELIRTMHPHDYNPAAPASVKSLHWGASEFIWPDCDWDKIVQEFLKAVEAAKAGNPEPLRAFVTETLGEPWSDQLGIIEDFGFLEARKQDYKYGAEWEPWSEEKIRFMAADRQEAGGEHYWYAIRAFGMFGKSRLVTYGRCENTAQLDAIREEFKVSKENACIDSGWKASEVYRFCASLGWKAFKGEPELEYFTHIIQSSNGSKKSVRRVWDKTYVDPFLGQRQGQAKKTLPLFRHVGNGTKDILAEFLTGLIGEFSIPETVGRDYLKQVSAEKRKEREDSKHRVIREWHRVYRDNHLFDCELIILVAAIITKTIDRGEVAKDNVPSSTDGINRDSGQTGQASAVL